MSTKTCESINKELIDHLIRENAIIVVSKAFYEITSDAERVAMCYTLLSDYELLPSFTCTNYKEKSPYFSEKYRNDGNRAFVHKDDMSAMYYYTRAVGYAPIGSKEIAIAYANRSAVAFSLGDFCDAVKDIDRALQGDYPDHLKFKLWKRKGKSLFELGKFLDARASFENSIEWLIKSNLDEDKCSISKTELTSLLQQCTSDGFNVKVKESCTLFELTHGSNPNLQCGSNAIEVEYSPDMGRHIIAKVDINPGDILVVEKPYSSIPLPNSYFFFCSYCHKRCHSLIPCLNCTLVFFCDEKCRTNSWKENHSIECKILPLLLRLDCDKVELLALRVLIHATEKGKKLIHLAESLTEIESFDIPSRKGFTNDIYISDSYKSIHNLEGNTRFRKNDYLFSRSIEAACLLHVLDSNTSFFKKDPIQKVSLSRKCSKIEELSKLRWDKIFAGGLILKFLQSMGSNGFSISEMRAFLEDESKTDRFAVASGIYPLMSLLNHSCVPNVVWSHYSGSTAVLTAIQAIKKGEQMFCNYRFHYATHTKEERQSGLNSQYKFTCKCIACMENWPLYINLPENNPKFLPGANIAAVKVSSKKFLDTVDNIISNRYKDNVVKWLPFLYSHLKLLQASIARPWKEYYHCIETISECLLFQYNHYIYKSWPLPLTMLKDEDVGVSPF